MEPLADTGPDGHPKRGGFLPPVPLPRRMWAGSRMEFFRPLRIGDAIRRESRIATVTAKEGRSGTLVFVTVRHEIFSGNERLLSDEHDIVYRDLDRAGSASGTSVAPNDHRWIRQIDPTPALAHLIVDEQAFAWLPEEDFVTHFASDVDRSRAKVMYAVQQGLSPAQVARKLEHGRPCPSAESGKPSLRSAGRRKSNRFF